MLSIYILISYENESKVLLQLNFPFLVNVNTKAATINSLIKGFSFNHEFAYQVCIALYTSLSVARH